MVVGPVGLVGLSVPVRASMPRVVMSLSPPEGDIVIALALPLPMTQCHLVTVALETSFRPRTAENFPTVQWTAAGGRGLSPDRARPPVGRGFSYHSERVIVPPQNMGVDTVTDRALGVASVRVPVQLTGSGPVGPIGVSVPLPVSHKAEFPSGLATAPVRTPNLHPARLAKVALVIRARQRTATTCPTAQWTEVGVLGLPSLPVLLPVGLGFKCHSGDVTARPPNMAASHVLERDVEPASVRPMSTVQWMGYGQSGRHGNHVNTHLVGGTSAVSSWVAVRLESASVFIGLTMEPSAKGTL